MWGEAWGLLGTATKTGLSLLFGGQRDTDTKEVMTGRNGQRLFPTFVEAFKGYWDYWSKWAWLTPTILWGIDLRKPLGLGKVPGPPSFPFTAISAFPSLLGLSLDPTLLCPTQNKPWKKLKTVLKYSPFVVSFRKHYPWVQLSGHAGESRGQWRAGGRQGWAETTPNWGQKATELLPVV